MLGSGRSWLGTTAARTASLLALVALAALPATIPIGRPALAAAPPAIELQGEALAEVTRIEEYLNRLTSVHGRFIQANPDGTYVEGDFYLDRPGKLRFEYDAPSPYLLVADETHFIYVDRKLEQVTYLPLSSTPAYFLVRENISFGDGLRLVDYRHEAGLHRLSLVQEDEPDGGSIVLTLTDKPLALRQWTIVDAQGAVTRVTLVDPTFGLELDRTLFRFVNPWRGRNRN